MEELRIVLCFGGLIPLILCSGFLSGSETALFSLGRHQRRQLARRRTVIESALDTLLHDPRGVLITILLGNMTVNVLFFVLSTVGLIALRETYALHAAVIGVLSILPLILLILLGEVLPKLVATRGPLTWARLAALPLLVFHRVLSPIRTAVNTLIITPFARLIAPRNGSHDLTREELGSLLELSQHHGVIDRDEEEMLQQVLTIGELKVRDLMTPRVDIDAFDLNSPPEHLLRLVREKKLRRIPVYEGDLDRVAGVVSARQIMHRPPQTREQIQELIKPILFVPEQQRVDKLLMLFRKRGATLALVVDEYGGTAGLVTLEDVVEQIVGDIRGHDEAPSEPEVEQLPDGSFRVSGNLPIHEWARPLGPIAQPPGISTLAGLVVAKLGRVPRVGDHTTIGNVRVEVEDLEGRRIRRLRLRLADENRDGDSNGKGPGGDRGHGTQTNAAAPSPPNPGRTTG